MSSTSTVPSAYSLESAPGVNELLDEIARAYEIPDYDPAKHLTAQVLAARLHIRRARAAQILGERTDLDKIEVRMPDGRRHIAFAKKGESITDPP